MRRDAVFLTVSLLISVPAFAEDTTPPARPIVSDEGTYTTSQTQLRAGWRSADPESGVVEYQYLIRRDWRHGIIVVPWRSSGTATSVTQHDLKLLPGRRYYFCVKAKNGAELWSSPGCSDGIRVEPPVPPTSRQPPKDRSAFSPILAKNTAERGRASGVFLGAPTMKQADRGLPIADTTPPTGVISINGGAPYATTRIVTLTLVATDDSGAVVQMRLSNDRRRDTAPEAYAPIKRWSLPTGQGTHTVYVRFCDQEGNWSEAARDTVTLDTVAPTLVIVYPTHGMLLGSS